MACVPRFRMFLLAAALLLMILPAGCKPVTRPGTVHTAPGGAFTLLLPPDFALVPAAGPARAGGTNFSFAEFRNAQTGERIVVGFLPVLGEPEVDAIMLMTGLSILPVGDEWQGMALSALTNSMPDAARYEAARVAQHGTVRLDVRDKESGAAISMLLAQQGETIAVLAATNPHELAHSAPGAALLEHAAPNLRVAGPMTGRTAATRETDVE